MKKTYLLSYLLIFALSFSKAQTTLNTAVDFTVTDIQGNSHNLFSILNSGKYVCLDFFFTTCPPCRTTSPYFKQAFTNYGCNTKDVFFMAIDNGDTDAEVTAFETTYLGGTTGYPAIGGNQGGGNAVVSAYGITAFPSYILIAPNKTIVAKDIWPLNSAASFDPIFNNNTLTKKSCLVGVEEQSLSANIKIFPNPAVDKLIIETSNNEKVFAVKVYDLLGKIQINKSLNETDRFELSVADLGKGIYYVEIVTPSGVVIKKFNKE